MKIEYEGTGICLRLCGRLFCVRRGIVLGFPDQRTRLSGRELEGIFDLDLSNPKNFLKIAFPTNPRP
jgi:hypothetical protein